MVVDGKNVTLYVDGGEAGRTLVVRKLGGTVIPGKLSVGKTICMQAAHSTTFDCRM